MASVALNAVPSIELPNVTRMEHRDRLDTMLENAKQQKVVQSNGFTSAAFKAVGHIFGDVQIVFQNIRGVSVSCISRNPFEEEFLIPPSTQIKYTGHKIIDGNHVFTAEGANVLLETERVVSPEDKARSEVEKLIETMESKFQKNELLTKKETQDFLKEVVEINVKHGVISEKEKEIYFKKEPDKKSIFDKDVEKSQAIPRNMSLKDMLLNAISNCTDSLGFKSISTELKNHISQKGKDQLAEMNKANLSQTIKTAKNFSKVSWKDRVKAEPKNLNALSR